MLANVVAHEALFRAGIVSFMIEQVAFLLLPLLLFRLLHRVHQRVAVAMVALAVTAVPVALIGVMHRLDALWLLTDSHGLPVATATALASLALKSYGHAIFVASLFWGLWLAPLGYLIAVSRSLPRLLGWLLMAGSLGYVIDVLTFTAGPT